MRSPGLPIASKGREAEIVVPLAARGTTMPRSVHVFMNERSGSCFGRREEVEAAFRAHNLPCQVTLVGRGMDLPRLAREAAEEPGAIVVAAGGDGTVNAIASALAGSRTCLGVLPLGTLNHFAKDLGLPLTLAEAVRAIAEGRPQPVDLGEVNGRLFVNNSSLGFYPGMVLQRERLKRVGWNKWLSLTVASVFGFLRFRRITVELTLQDGSERLSRTTPFLFIGNNEYRMEGSEAGSRTRLDGGRLYLSLAPGATRLSLLALTLAALRRKVAQAEHYESLCVQECTIHLKRRRTHIAVDGELVRVGTPLCYRIHPGALQVLTLPRATP